MTIAVNTGFSGEGQPDDNRNFIFECISLLAEKHPQHQFVFLFDKSY